MRKIKLKHSCTPYFIIFLILFSINTDSIYANWWDFIENDYGDSDIQINYWNDYDDFMSNASDNTVDSFFDGLSGIYYEDSNDSDYAWYGYIPTSTTYDSSNSNSNSSNNNSSNNDEDDNCNDPCICWGDCDDLIVGNSPTTPNSNNNKSKKSPEEVDCDETDLKNANKANTQLNTIARLPTLTELANNTNSYDNLIRRLEFYANHSFAELGYTYEKRIPSYNSHISNLIYGSLTEIVFQPTNYTAALIHTHPVQKIGDPTPTAGPSPQDFVGLIEARFKNGCSLLTDSYVAAYGGAFYVLSITDAVAAEKFYSKYANNLETENGMFKDETMFNKEYLAMNKYLTNKGFSAVDAHDASMAYILDKYATGVTLMKKEDKSKPFKSMHTTGTMNSKNKITNAISTKCK